MKKRIIPILAVVATALVVTTAAVANTTSATANIAAGGLSYTIPATATLGATLSGADQTITYAPTLNLVDARGNGGGWNFTIAQTAFSDGSGHSLPNGTVTSMAQACSSGSSCTAATNSVAANVAIPTGSGAKFFNAAVGSGLGKVDVTPTITFSVPGNAYAGTYTSTLTIAATAGP